MSEWDVTSEEAVPLVTPKPMAPSGGGGNPWEVVGHEAVLPNAGPSASAPPPEASASPAPSASSGWEVESEQPQRAGFFDSVTRGMRNVEGTLSSGAEWLGETTCHEAICKVC